MRRSYDTHFSLVNGGHRGNLVYGYVAGNPCMPVIAGGNWPGRDTGVATLRVPGGQT
jgi:hypothetical protein